MTCRDFIEFLWRYLSDELAPEERFEFDAHLAVCPECVSYLTSYQTTIELGKEALADPPNGPAPEDAPEELVQAILAARGKGRE